MRRVSVLSPSRSGALFLGLHVDVSFAVTVGAFGHGVLVVIFTEILIPIFDDLAIALASGTHSHDPAFLSVSTREVATRPIGLASRPAGEVLDRAADLALKSV